MARHVTRFLLLRMIVLLLSSYCAQSRSTCIAQSQSDPRIQQIEERIVDESAHLAEVSRREQALNDDLVKVRRTLDSLSREEQKLTKELNSIVDQRRALQAEKEVKEKELAALTINFRKRLRALYESTPRQGASLLPIPANLEQSDIDVGRYAFFLTKVRDYDSKLFEAWHKQSIAHNARLDELRRLQETQVGYVSKVSSQRQVVRDKVAEQEKLVATLRSERQKESIIASLRAQALRLETVVASLTGSGAMSGERRAPSNSKERAQPKRSFTGPGLERSQGKLSYPVSGKIIRNFGERKTTLYEESVVSKGMEFATIEGASVKAIAEGRVAYRGKMPGVGKIVILDHGERYYSLYGMLTEYSVADGDVISAGETIGKVGAPDKVAQPGKGINFYFEIRKHGSPINPAKFFK